MQTTNLTEEFINKLFNKLFSIYGNRWFQMWKTGIVDAQGNDQGSIAVRSTWAAKLACYVDKPWVIEAACNNLSKTPPNLIEFYDLCVAGSLAKVETYHALPNNPSESSIKHGKLQLESIKRMLEKSNMLKGKGHVESN